ncbi:hypothetical protein KCU77_g30, partial [Aureobasidium melanogenum]
MILRLSQTFDSCTVLNGRSLDEEPTYTVFSYSLMTQSCAPVSQLARSLLATGKNNLGIVGSAQRNIQLRYFVANEVTGIGDIDKTEVRTVEPWPVAELIHRSDVVVIKSAIVDEYALLEIELRDFLIWGIEDVSTVVGSFVTHGEAQLCSRVDAAIQNIGDCIS